MNPPNFCCNICSEASMLASNLLQFLGLPRLGVEFGESAPAVQREDFPLLGGIAPVRARSWAL